MDIVASGGATPEYEAMEETHVDADAMEAEMLQQVENHREVWHRLETPYFSQLLGERHSGRVGRFAFGQRHESCEWQHHICV